MWGAHRTFLYDSLADEVLTPGGIGLQRDSVARSVSDDGNLIVYVQRETVGLPWTIVEWDRATDERIVSPYSPLDGVRSSADGRWTLDRPDDRTVIRRDNASDDPAQVVPSGGHRIVDARVYDGGRVLLALEIPTPEVSTAVQIATWDGPGTGLRLLSTAADGSPAAWGVRFQIGSAFVANRDATLVAFLSQSPDIPPALTEPGGWRLFEVRMPTVESPPPPTTAPDETEPHTSVPDGRPSPGRPATGDPAPVEPAETYCFPVGGARPGALVVVNVTPTLASGPGHGTMHPSGTEAGPTSNVNFDAGTTDPNVALLPVGDDGEICYTNSIFSTVEIIVDQLLVADPDVFTLPSPTGAVRLLDTRGDDTPVAPAATRCIAAHGSPGDYAVVNITPVLATGPGHGTLHSGDDPAGPTSNVNYTLGSVDPNVAIARVGADRTICFTNSEFATTHLVLDQLLVADPDVFTLPSPTGAVRLTDTRRERFS